MDLQHFKEKLETRLEELDVRLHEIEEELDSPVSKDWEDKAVEREGDEVLEKMGNNGLVEARLIQEALGRIEKGTYGECLKCAEPISDERLEAVPYAPLCRFCAGGGK